MTECDTLVYMTGWTQLEEDAMEKGHIYDCKIWKDNETDNIILSLTKKTGKGKVLHQQLVLDSGQVEAIHEIHQGEE